MKEPNKQWTPAHVREARARLLELDAGSVRGGGEPNFSPFTAITAGSAEHFCAAVSAAGFDSTVELAHVYQEVEHSIPVPPRCIARSYTGRVCTLSEHVAEDPVHQSADGTRWRGDADTLPNGSDTLPPVLRAAVLALIEAQTYGDKSRAARSEVCRRREAVFMLLWDECGVPLLEPSASDEALWDAYKYGYQRAADDIAYRRASFEVEAPYEDASERVAWKDGYAEACCAFRLGTDLNKQITNGDYGLTELAGVELVCDLLDNPAKVRECRPDPRMRELK